MLAFLLSHITLSRIKYLLSLSLCSLMSRSHALKSPMLLPQTEGRFMHMQCCHSDRYTVDNDGGHDLDDNEDGVPQRLLTENDRSAFIP